MSGNRLVIAVQTVMELYFGACKAGWGEVRLRRLDVRMLQAVILPADEMMARTCAELRLACLRMGHPLADRVHANDLWVASAAVRHAIPLVSDDRVFVGVPGLELRTIDRFL